MLVRENKKIYISDYEQEKLEELPKGSFILLNDPYRGFHLSELPTSTLPTKIYGDFEEVAERISDRFKKRSLGVLLTGLKGAGKSLLSELISEKVGVARILVSEYYSGAAFSEFMGRLDSPAIFYFNEFDKTYDTEEKQNELLSILDGTINSAQKRLFIFTTNASSVTTFMMNRPGRVLYRKHFGGLTTEEIEEIVDDNLVNTEHRSELLSLAGALVEVSMDVMLNWVEEMNTYNEDPRQALKLLNISPENGTFKVNMIIGGKSFEGVIHHHPLQFSEYTIEYKEQREGQSWYSYRMYTVNLGEFSRDYYDGMIELEHRKTGDKLMFTKLGEIKTGL